MGALGRDEGTPVEQATHRWRFLKESPFVRCSITTNGISLLLNIIAALTGTDRPRKYWADLKVKLYTDEGFTELSDRIGQLKMPSDDGKMYLTDAVNVETALRIIQSIPAAKQNRSRDGSLEWVRTNSRNPRPRDCR